MVYWGERFPLFPMDEQHDAAFRGPRQPVVYGVYDNRAAPWWVRINDAFIDSRGVSLKEKAYFFELLSVMIDAGIPMLSALDVLRDKTQSERFKRVIATIAYGIEHGETLAGAASKFPSVFSDTEIGMLRSGELTGGLHIALQKLSDSITRTLELQLKVRQAVMYPATIIVTLLLAFAVIITIVVPPLKDLFESVDAALPTSLALLISANDFVAANWWWLLAILGVGAYLLRAYVRTEQGKLWKDGLLLKIPAVGDLLKKMIMVKFARSLATLLDSGLPLTKTIKTVAMSVGNDVYRLALDGVLTKVQTGKKISEALDEADGLFSRDLTAIISVGEQTATISTSSQKVASQYEREIDHSLKNMTSVIEPLAIVIVGVAVGWFAFLVLGSIFSISENISA